MEDVILCCSLQTLGGRLLGRQLDCVAPETFACEDKSFGGLRAALPLHAENSRPASLHSSCRGALWGMLGRTGEPLSSASGPAPGTLSRCGKVCAHAGRGSVALAAEVNGAVPAAGEALGGLGRCGPVWSPGCSQHPVLSTRAPAAGPGVGILRTWGTHLFRTLDHLCRSAAWDGSERWGWRETGVAGRLRLCPPLG